jgi:hypothetical protein
MGGPLSLPAMCGGRAPERGPVMPLRGSVMTLTGPMMTLRSPVLTLRGPVLTVPRPVMRLPREEMTSNDPVLTSRLRCLPAAGLIPPPMGLSRASARLTSACGDRGTPSPVSAAPP